MALEHEQEPQAQPVETPTETPDDYDPRVRGAEALSDDTRQLLADIAKHDNEEGGPPPPAADPEPVEPAEPTDDPTPASTITPEEAASADPRFAESWKALQERELQIAETSQKVKDQADRVNLADKQLTDARGQYLADRVGGLKNFVKAAIGTDDEDAIKQEIASLYEVMTHNELGMELDPSLNQLDPATRARRELDQYKRDTDTKFKDMEASKLKAEKDAQVTAAVTEIGGFLGDSEKFPYLMAQKDHEPAELVWDIIEQAYEDKEEIPLQKAAEMANEHFFEQAKHYRDLLNRTESTEQPGAQETSARTTEVETGPRTLTDRHASETPTRTSGIPAYSYDDADDSKQRALALLKQ